MKFIFNLLTSISVRFRWLTLLLVVVALVLGAVAATQLNQELLPPIEFPQTIILSQASGMTSEQVLTVLTERLEPEIAALEDIINLESQTTGAFGAVIIAYNDFGLDQAVLQDDIREAMNNVWLPTRRIEAPDGQNPQDFASGLIADLPPDVMLYLAQVNSNFLFQLSPQVWSALSDETVRTLLAYLAVQEETTTGSALERLVDKEIVPQLRTISEVANVTIDGGQALPGQEAAFAVADADIVPETQSVLLRLSPEIWDVVSAKAGGLGALNQAAVDELSQVEFVIPDEPPAMPENWQFDHFNDATDLLEIETLTAPIADILNDFYDTGRIVGPLGQTDDLEPETVTRMLEIEPSMVEYFEADQLVAMSPEVFAVLPDDFVAGLDGFTRDALAAASLAESITGETAQREPVDLPDPWRIQPPGILTFSFADLPLATFSVSSTAEQVAPQVEDDTSQQDAVQTDDVAEDDQDATEEQTQQVSIPEGPPLPAQFGAVRVDTADDLINFELPDALADAFGVDILPAAQVLNTMAIPPDLSQGAAGGEGGQAPALSLDLIGFTTLITGGRNIIGQMTPEAVQFIADNDPDFIADLESAVFAAFSDEVLALPEVSPPLADAWNVLSEQPQFGDRPLETADDLVAIGAGDPAAVLNTINDTVPGQFEGYEVRLFNSLEPVMIRYFQLEQPDFLTTLDSDVLLKFSPEVLAALPDDFVSALPEDMQAQVVAIAKGEQNSAFAALQELYATDIPAADPDAPALNPAWSQIAGFYNIEMDSADDFFRFPDDFAFEDAGAFINSIFGSAQGANFARNSGLISNTPVEAIEYILNRDASVLDSLDAEPLRLMTDEQLSLLPESLQDRANDGGEVFTPTTQVTRTNGQPSLFVTVYKDAEANTVSTYAAVEELMLQADEENADIVVDVVFEQSSFVEESISGVAREGGLGAVFAIVIILIFLSSGVWNLRGRRLVGMMMIAVFAVLLGLLVASNLEAAGNDWGEAFALTDVVFRVLLVIGIAAGFVVLFWPGSLPDPAWRATIVIGISIPLSILIAFIGMRWLSPTMYDLIQPLAEGSDFWSFVLRLFPEELTLNIMTLSGLTVAVGRVVDDSIVVLENIFRQIELGGDKKEAVLSGARDVSSAIFTATLVAVVVFLPLGLTGGIIGAFFLPFGLAVTYALLGSFIVAVTAVPALAYIVIDPDDVPDEGDIWLARYYLPVLRWSLSSSFTKAVVIVLAIASFFFGGYLFTQRPAAFLPSFGEPQISVNISMPPSTRIVELNDRVEQLEQFILNDVPEEALTALQTTVGGGGANFETLLTGNNVVENQANITIGLDVSADDLDAWTQRIREEAETIFGDENVTVSAGSLTEGGFGGFSLVISGPVETLEALDPLIIETLNGVDGITNVTSNLSESQAGSDDGPVTYIRVNQESALSYAAELETEDTIGVTQAAIAEIESLDDLPDTVTVSQGFESETQTEGFASVFVAMIIASVIVITILILTFGSAVYWIAIFLSVLVAPVGAAIALALSQRVLGISALIGLLMLLGLVITNAVVLIDRVRSNLSERNMNLYDALVEAGGRRLRPILMTSLATIIALTPLAIGLSEGAIIAAELGTVVIGGVFSSTLLTLIVVPVMYSILTPVHRFLLGLVGIKAKV